MNSPDNTIGELLVAARKCLGYAPGAGNVDEWRREFDRLADLRRKAGRSLIRSDRDRLAAIVADFVFPAANAGTAADRAFLQNIARALADFVENEDRFDDASAFRRIGND